MVLDNENDIRVVGQAADGDEAVTLAASQGAQVVLMDLRMPGTDGVEATRRLSNQHPEIKVVVLTTYADDESISDALVAGAIGYLTKGRRAPPDRAGRPLRRGRSDGPRPGRPLRLCCAGRSSRPDLPPPRCPRPIRPTASPPERWTCFEA